MLLFAYDDFKRHRLSNIKKLLTQPLYNANAMGGPKVNGNDGLEIFVHGKDTLDDFDIFLELIDKIHDDDTSLGTPVLGWVAKKAGSVAPSAAEQAEDSERQAGIQSSDDSDDSMADSDDSMADSMRTRKLAENRALTAAAYRKAAEDTAVIATLRRRAAEEDALTAKAQRDEAVAQRQTAAAQRQTVEDYARIAALRSA